MIMTSLIWILIMFNAHAPMVQTKKKAQGKQNSLGYFCCLINCINDSFIPQVGHILVLLSTLEIAEC